MKQAITIMVRGKAVKIEELDALPVSRWQGWTQEEIAILRKYYPSKDTGALARLIGRNPKAMQAKAKDLGLRKIGVVKKE